MSMKITKNIIGVILLVGATIISVVSLNQAKDKTRTTDQGPTIVVSTDTGPRFVDPLLRLEASLPESFEAGTRSTVDGWESLTIVPVGNVEKLPTYPFTIDYRTRPSQQIVDIPSFLQTLFKQPFSTEKTVTIVDQSVQQYKSSGSTEAYRAVLFTRNGQDILIVAKAQDEGMMPSYIAGYDAFLRSLQVQAE